MGKRSVWAAAAAVLLVSCASLPPPDRGTRTLLAISISARNSSYGGFPLAYEFGIKESPRRISVNVRDGVVVFDGLPAGTYTIDRVYTVQSPEIVGGQYGDSNAAEPVGPWKFTLREGEITILPVGLAVTVVMRGSDTHFQTLTLAAADRQRALSGLARYENREAWKVAEDAPGGALAPQTLRPRQVDEAPVWD